ncbi:MAG: glycosyltransferase family 2 protein [Candidatus Uhrbacteria bacterium]|nr:glycosyltransferase family 2 protein [Candidatus Uhrbacteria bacterium]
MRIVAVIPAYNEENRVHAAVADVARFVDAVIVIDDGSSDNTVSEAEKAGAYVLIHPVNRGQGAAIQTGTDYALDVLDADIIVHFDADGQMSGEDIKSIIQPIIEGSADVVLGSRFLGLKSNMPFGRLITNRLSWLFTLLVSGIKVTDAHNGFRAFGRHAAEEIRITLNRMAHASEILDQIKVRKLRYVERPVSIKYSSETLAKGQSFFNGFTVLKDYFKAKFLG